MAYVWTFLAPFAKDKAVWMAVASWLLKLANAKLGLGLDDHLLTTAAAGVSTWAATHVTHLKILGGDGKLDE